MRLYGDGAPSLRPDLLEQREQQLAEHIQVLQAPEVAAVRYTALNARKTASSDISDFDLQMGLDGAARHLKDDAA